MKWKLILFITIGVVLVGAIAGGIYMNRQGITIQDLIATFLPARTEAVWSFVAFRGGNFDKVSDNNINAVPTATIETGQILIVRAVSDDGASPDSSFHTVNDTVGNTYTLLKESQQLITVGTAADGVIVSLWISKITTNITTTDNVHLYTDAAVTAKAIGFDVFSVASGFTFQLDGSAVNTTTNLIEPNSITINGLSNIERLWIGIDGTEGPTADNYGADPSYTNFSNQTGTTGGGGASNVKSPGGYLIATQTGDTFQGNNIGTQSRDYASILVALSEVSDTDTQSPKWSQNTTNGTTAGTFIQHSVNWTDNVALSGYIFSFDNGNGTFYNDTFVTFSGTQNWSNVSKLVNTTSGVTIQWWVWANDTTNNINSTSVFSYVTTSAPTDSCTYVSGNWDIDCSDFCNITSNENLGGNNISIVGTGVTTIIGNITNWINAFIQGTDQSNICTVRTFNGGGLKD